MIKQLTRLMKISIVALGLSAAAFQAASAETMRSVNCVNKTNQTIALFDADGSRVLIAPHMSKSVMLYTPGVVVWMVATDVKQAMLETALRNKISRLVFSQSQDNPQQILCSPELSFINRMIVRAKLATRNFASGLSFGAVSAEDNEPIYNEDQALCNASFCTGIACSAIVVACIAAKIAQKCFFEPDYARYAY